MSCVRKKLEHAAPAAELYTSPLFLGARAAVEQSCGGWYILSAEHHLVRPDDVIAPYDRTLNDAPAHERRGWSRVVLDQLERELGGLNGATFEIHAGRNYYDWGLADGLRAAGGIVALPLDGLTLGQRLQYYNQAGAGLLGATSRPAPVRRSASSTGRLETTDRGRSTYHRLSAHLVGLDRAKWDATFEEVEEVLGCSLPASARRHRAWWANTSQGHSHARAWLDAGFVTRQVDLAGGRLSFVRQQP